MMEPAKAVSLGYAPQDVEVARSICEAPPAGGAEVTGLVDGITSGEGR